MWQKKEKDDIFTRVFLQEKWEILLQFRERKGAVGLFWG